MKNPNGPSIEEKESMADHLLDLNDAWLRTPPCRDQKFPCVLGCLLCREALRCNECGSDVYGSFQLCTNGRCNNCCPKVCKHS